METSKPVILESPDFSKLKGAVQDYINAVATEEYVDDDVPHYIFEYAVEAFFGEDVWEFINSKS